MLVLGLGRSVDVSYDLEDEEREYHVCGYCQIDLCAANMEILGN